ncbi:mechanosensitive ion channel family protein [Halostella sp. JP-L12]|uniref:mechanosensitive ion channel family protein n=1 Tax=Halostella TaxID=1843185 RepID=UPI000EF7B1CF|nr:MULTISPECIES: mechanosensitive ion channel family protein [Halostella]NHN49623.1 mechanosensitive ion channel family protein [Halostella sp. JP-L12]
MTRRLGSLSILAGLACALGVALVRSLPTEWPTVGTLAADVLAAKLLTAAAVAFGAYGLYLLVFGALERRSKSKRRLHDVRNVLRLAFGAAALVGVFGALTEQWVGVLFSLGVVGFAVTFALQQPLFSLLGWVYILVKRPYQVGDRVRIEEAKGDVIDVDFLVTTLWEINGDLVTSNQPSGRIVTVPNSVVLSSEVFNYSWEEFPYVWNEVSVQVAYETDLEFARSEMIAVADDHLGEEMRRNVARYREVLSETPVELEVNDRPSVNVVQQESWVELRLRYLVHPKRGQRTKNALYERILERFNDRPDRVAFPVSRNR